MAGPEGAAVADVFAPLRADWAAETLDPRPAGGRKGAGEGKRALATRGTRLDAAPLATGDAWHVGEQPGDAE